MLLLYIANHRSVKFQLMCGVVSMKAVKVMDVSKSLLCNGILPVSDELFVSFFSQPRTRMVRSNLKVTRTWRLLSTILPRSPQLETNALLTCCVT